MKDIHFDSTIPLAGDYNRLRRDAGWPEMDPETVAFGLPGSLYCVCAFDETEVVGVGRVVGDGRLCFYIQDVIVLKSHQGRGIGKQIMNLLVAYIAAHATEHSYLGLMAAAGKEGFYQKFGFESRPTATLGCGMTRFWNSDDRASVRGHA